MSRTAPPKGRNPVGMILHWNPDATCGTCAHRELVRAGGKLRRRCMWPLEIAGETRYPNKNKDDVSAHWAGCMAHKPNG